MAEEGIEVKFSSSQHMQDCLLMLGVEDDEVAKHLSMFIKPKCFVNDIAGIVCGLIIDYYMLYKCAPKEHFPDILQEKLDKLPEPKQVLLSEYIYKLYEIFPNKGYVLDNLAQFVRHTNVLKGIVDGAQLVEKQKYDQAEKIIISAFRTGIVSSIEGIEYLDDFSARAEPVEVLCKTEIEALDGIIGGICRRELGVWLASTNIGKCLKVGTKVIMYDGSLRAVEDIKVGEKLMGPDSTPRTVQTTTRGCGNLYQVKQSNAMDYIVNEQHILALRKANWKAKNWESKAPTLTIPVTEFKKVLNNIKPINTPIPKRCYKGYKASCLHFYAKKLYIHPYFLGMWLGDGNKSSLYISSVDDEIIKFCHDYAIKLGGTISIKNFKGSTAKRILIKETKLWEEFKLYNLPYNKHIPHDFLSNSEENRLQLLAGLIDTDGYIHKSSAYSITQKSDDLARQIKFLADSLGFKTCINRKPSSCMVNGIKFTGVYSTVLINGDIWRIPCRIARKKLNPSKKRDYLSSTITIEPYGIGEYAGFSLDGDHLFLLEDGTVTHNSWALGHCGKVSLTQRTRTLIYTLEMAKEWYATRIDMGITGMGTKNEVIVLPHLGEKYTVKSVFENKATVRKALKFLKSLGGRLLIKGMPEGGLTLSRLKEDLDILEATRNFIPDMIIIDYADLMTPETKYNEYRHDIAEIYKGLRQIALERNCAVLTASQSNRASMGARVVSLKHFAEDIQKANIADVVLSLCQTDEEAKLSKMRIFCCKNRNGIKGFQIENWYSYHIGQFSLHSQLYMGDEFGEEKV